MKIGQSIPATVVSNKCSSEKKSHIFLILNQKLKMVKFSEEGTPKAETGQKLSRKLGLLHQTVSHIANVKEKFFS